jgi:hypothetical protein
MAQLRAIKTGPVHVVAVSGDKPRQLAQVDQGGVAPPTDTYDGPYTITPGPTSQVLQTEGLFATGNITVGPVPNNYGLITWDGSVLTVS